MKKNTYTQWRSLRSVPARIHAYTEKVREKDRTIGAFLEFDPEKHKSEEDTQSAPVSTRLSPAGSVSAHRPQAEKSPLLDIPFGVKDNIAVEGFGLSCASKALEGLPSPYSATAVDKLTKAGAWVVGKTNLDEFGMGSSTENSAFKKTLNPWDTSRTPGGSSGGSAAAVASGMVPFALGTDTGGSVRQPAAFCGIYGLKPSYGAVSRYGLVAYASSLEGVGILSSDLEITKDVFYTIQGEDPMDQTTARAEPSSGKPPATVGILEHLEGLSPGVEEGYRNSVETLKKLGFAVKTVSLPTLDYVIPAYYTIASAEASANLARYTGIRYGYRNEEAEEPRELVETSRDESLGAEVKLRILLGTYVLRSGFQEQYYIKAQKIRTALRMDFEKIFHSIDIMMMPVFPTQAFLFGEKGLDPFQQKMADKFTATANLAGIPALSFPTGLVNGLPVGMQFLAPMFKEKRLFKAAEIYAQAYAPELPKDSLDFPKEALEWEKESTDGRPEDE